MRIFPLAMAASAAIGIGVSALHAAPVINCTFQEGTHGEVITNKFLPIYGVNVSAINVGGGPNKAIIFDSRQRNTADPDLEGWNSLNQTGPMWSRGNLAGKVDLGKILIIAENDIDANNDGLIDSPDDEGSRPAGTITFNFRDPITELGFNLIDIEGPTEFGQNSGFVATFGGTVTRPDGRVVGVNTTVGFGQFITPGSPFYDPTVRFGDHSANRIKPILASQVGMNSFSRVEVNFGGSGAIDQLVYRFVPEPGAVSAGLVAAGLLAVRRRSR
jgi:hypothetical protein